ncbi:MAG: ABC transporter permease [Flavobacteriales bacterium]
MVTWQRAVHTAPSWKGRGELSSGFALRFFRNAFHARFEWSELLRQCLLNGYRSLPLVAVTGFIMGLVLTGAGWPPWHASVRRPCSQPWWPAHQRGARDHPVITRAHLCGQGGQQPRRRAGSMKVTEQIDAMEVSGTNPFRYLVVTRVWSTTLMLPILVVLAGGIAIWACWVGVNLKDVVSWHLFIQQVFDSLEFSDFLPSFIKRVYFFGFAIGIVGCYKGFTTQKGTEGVGRSAFIGGGGLLLIFIMDLVAVQVTDILGYN